MSSHDRGGIVVTVMSLSLLLLSSPRASKILFSHNTPATMRRYAEKRTKPRGLDLHKRIIPARREAIPIHASTYKHHPPHPHIYKDDAASASESIVSSLSLKALLYTGLFFVDETENAAGLLLGQSASALHRVMAILSRSSSSRGNLPPCSREECNVFGNTTF